MANELSSEIYKEHILETYKNPHNFGKIDSKAKTHEHFGSNPFCGDEIRINLIVENWKIKDARFEGKGCAISTASASLLTDKIKGLSVQETLKISKNDILQMLMIPIGPVRIKCALLSLEVLKKALEK